MKVCDYLNISYGQEIVSQCVHTKGNVGTKKIQINISESADVTLNNNADSPSRCNISMSSISKSNSESNSNKLPSRIRTEVRYKRVSIKEYIILERLYRIVYQIEDVIKKSADFS